MAFSDVTATTKVSLFGLCGALLLFLISFVAPYWVSALGIHAGLWTFALNPAWIRATQGMECLALMAGFASVILLGLFVFVDSFYRNGSILLLSKVAPMVAGSLSMLGVIIFGAKVVDMTQSLSVFNVLGFSFWLCAVSSVGFFVCGGINLGTRRPM